MWGVVRSLLGYQVLLLKGVGIRGGREVQGWAVAIVVLGLAGEGIQRVGGGVGLVGGWVGGCPVSGLCFCADSALGRGVPPGMSSKHGANDLKWFHQVSGGFKVLFRPAEHFGFVCQAICLC